MFFPAKVAKSFRLQRGVTPFIEYLVKLPERTTRIALISRMLRHAVEGISLGDLDASRNHLRIPCHGSTTAAREARVWPDRTRLLQRNAPILWEEINKRRVKLQEFLDKEGLGQIDAV